MASFGDLNRVNTNIHSLDSQLSLNKLNKQMAENQLRMSTGLIINRAEDDSAGFSIATKLHSRIGGLSQAMQNVGDAKSSWISQKLASSVGFTFGKNQD